MGLFTSMSPLPSQFNGARFMLKGKASEIFDFEINLWKGHLSQDDLHRLHIHYYLYGTHSNLPSKKTDAFRSSLFLCSANVQRTYLDQSIKRIEIRDTIKGTPIGGVLFLLPGPFPGVIDMFGGIGGCIEIRAALLAKQGFITLALAYFDYQHLAAKDYWDYNMVYFDRVIEWLLGHPNVRKGGVGMVGLCTGAQNVLLSALRNPRVWAAICISTNLYMASDPSIDVNPLNYVFEADVANSMGTVEKLDGMDVARIGGSPILPRPLLTAKHDNPLLLIMGQEDKLFHWPTVYEIREQLFKSGKRNHWLEIIPGQGHLMEPPYSPMCVTTKAGGTSKKTKIHPGDHCQFFANTLFYYGGKREIHEEGQELGWKILTDFFKIHLMGSISKL